MKLSDYPILGSPSADAVVPVIDGGANYTYPLSSLGSSGGYSFTLDSDAASIPIPLLDKEKAYSFVGLFKVTAVSEVTFNVDTFTNSATYQTRYIFGYSAGLVTGLNNNLVGISIASPPVGSFVMVRGEIALFDQLRIACTVQRTEGVSNGSQAQTQRTGRCSVPLSNISGSQVKLNLTTNNAPLTSGSRIIIREI